ncbi:branched-chain amino acid ABC transporter substrate-binding protein [Zavarzinia compransoris]|uniref:branched-chain amino acid ABC transporter substrate-binding protein n=1 Tax=Zavarzinia marina TaxID=2911065 RepID=UPI001F47D6F1|nr:branched-chain amino acid ABC transporter substrate-binding protein [Zavarzinia marina]MCF4165947.1 branched-chain amino acid ABC transporter substrate-binding protein [Zavarzinia marina]
MRKLLLGLVAIIAFGAAVAWFWTRGDRAPDPTAAGETASALPEIVLGLAAPLTGSQAAFGQQMKTGTEFAIKVINTNGGIEGRPVRLVTADDGCTAGGAAKAAADLVDAGVTAVIGHFCSAASRAAAAVYGPADVVMITPGSTDPRLTADAPPGGGMVFRTVWRDDYQGIITAALVKQSMAGKKVAVVRDASVYGQQLVHAFTAALAKLELPAPAVDLTLGSDLSAKSAAAKVKASGAGVVFVVAAPAAAGQVVKALRQGGVTASIVGPDALASADFAEAAGKAADGAIITFARNPLTYPGAAKAVEKMTALGLDPSGYAMNAFAAAEVLSAALRPVVKPNPTAAIDGKRLAATIRVNRFTTVLGEIAFDANGDLARPGVVYYVWKGGELTAM